MAVAQQTATAKFNPLPHLPAPTRDLEQAKRDMDEYGCCVLADVLTPEQVERLLERTLDQARAETANGVASCESGAGKTVRYDNEGPNQRVWSLLNKGEEYRALAEHPATLEIIRHVLGQDVLLSSFTANIAGKGGEAMFMHQDQGSLPTTLTMPVVTNVAWVLSNYTDEGGATRIIPGSHKFGRPTPEEIAPIETLPAAAPPGSAILFEGRTWHGTGKNITNEPRVALLSFYCVPWLRQQENAVASISDEVLETASDELKALLGFKTWNALGGLDGHNTYGEPFTSRSRAPLGKMSVSE
ncbi:phytanoyl-CoA dioxygenase family protein [Hyphomonas sp.]|uniref:phytanoyl-CoA dioxygenase family protein n=1 Tax=Hyphomonas sp. TaxID=87 RepID=UPI00352786CB